MRSWRGALPGFSFEFVDLNARSMRNLARRRLPVASKLPLLHLQDAGKRKDTAALMRTWAHHYRHLRRMPGGQSSVNRLLSYLAAVSSDDLRRITAAYQTIERTTEKNDVTTIAERLRRQGRREGRREVRVDLLRMQLEERFGPLSEAVLAKLTAASATDLRRWARRILKAKTLAQTLA